MSRNVNVPTLTAAQAAAAGHRRTSGGPNPDVRQHQPVRQSIGDSWFDGLTLSLTTRSRTAGAGRRVCRTRCRSRSTPPATRSFRRRRTTSNIARREGALGQRSAPPARGQRHNRATAPARPFAATLRRHADRVVFAYASALPFNPQAGVDLNNDTTINDRPARHGTQFGSHAVLGGQRSTARRAARRRSISGCRECSPSGARQRVELIAEGFNMFNRTNIVNINSKFGAGRDAVSDVQAGRPRSATSGSSNSARAGASEVIPKSSRPVSISSRSQILPSRSPRAAVRPRPIGAVVLAVAERTNAHVTLGGRWHRVAAVWGASGGAAWTSSSPSASTAAGVHRAGPCERRRRRGQTSPVNSRRASSSTARTRGRGSGSPNADGSRHSAATSNDDGQTFSAARTITPAGIGGARGWESASLGARRLGPCRRGWTAAPPCRRRPWCPRSARRRDGGAHHHHMAPRQDVFHAVWRGVGAPTPKRASRPTSASAARPPS